MSLVTQMVAARRRARASADESSKRRRVSSDAEDRNHLSADQDVHVASRGADAAAGQAGRQAGRQAAATPITLSVKSFYGRDSASSSAAELRLQRFIGHVRQRLDTAGHTYETFPLQEQAFNFADAHELRELIRCAQPPATRRSALASQVPMATSYTAIHQL